MEGRPLSPRLEPKVESAPVMIISNQDVRNGWPATRKNGIVPGKGIWETGPKRPSGTLILICTLGRNHAVRTQLVRVAAEKALPFDVKIPTPGLRTPTRRHRWGGSRPCAPTLWFSGCLAQTEGGPQADLTWREESESRCSGPQGSARIPAPYPWSRRSRSRRSPRDRARRRFSGRRGLIRVRCGTHDPAGCTRSSVGCTRRGESSSKLADEYGLGKFQRGDGGFAGHGGEVVDELVQGLPALQVVQ